MKDEYPELCHQLCFDLMSVIKQHYERGPVSRQRVHEVINALAIVTAMLIASLPRKTPGVMSPLQFFFQAFRGQIAISRRREEQNAAEI